MKKRSTFLLSFVFSIFFVPSMTQAADSAQATIMINGVPVKTVSFIQKGRTMVHSRFFEHTGVAVNWSDRSKSVQLKRNGRILTLPSGKSYAEFFVKETDKWQRDNLAVPTVNRNGKTYIPLRYVAQKLGMKVSYNPKLSQVSIQYPTASSRSSHATEDSDLNWLYRITEAEARGESYEGKVAVAATVLNRVKSPDWPDTIKDVIFQVTNKNGVDHYQFSPVASKLIYRISPSSDTIKAVQEALKGNDPTRGATLFYNPKISTSQWMRSRTATATIGNHVFAK
ncbi:cell wall hydrolase [Ammoniphilus sp. YIM 78166]|uniref:cell wall hydrolase n=1 Tax=Ammoniphilus sp. YIM 78166 TaxID=1644106 RepID=UPI0010702B08|nr:cell wall hydrolase [Ammoniphilus sp. YIM 78166]